VLLIIDSHTAFTIPSA